jgi:GcrA cell cycle regulator
MNRYFARLHRDPRQLSFVAIAKEMEVKFNITMTRNACIGKARRLGLPMRKFGTPRQPIERAALKPRKVAAVEAPIAPVEAIVPEVLPPEGLTIYQLRDSTCHWPLGKTYAYPPFMYCGCPALLGRPYCEAHTEKATGRSHDKAHA